MSRYTLLGSPYVRIAALPVDKFPKKGSSALSVFADTVISEPGIRAVLENSAPSFYAAVTKNLAEDSVGGCGHFLGDSHAAIPWL